MRLGAVLAAMLLVSVAFVPAVSAKENTVESNLSDPTVIKALVDKLNKEGDNAYKAFEKLSPQEQAAVIEAGKVTNITTEIITEEGEVSANGITCNSPREVISGYGLYGKLWSYFQQIDRCYDGSTLTEVTRTKWGETYYLCIHSKRNGAD